VFGGFHYAAFIGTSILSTSQYLKHGFESKDFEAVKLLEIISVNPLTLQMCKPAFKLIVFFFHVVQLDKNRVGTKTEFL
jgi:hypothetical protein